MWIHMRTCGSPSKTPLNVHITIFLYCLDPDLSFNCFSKSFLYWWKHILAHVRREFVRRLGIGFLYIQLENNFCSQAFQIDLAVSLFSCFYILTFTSNENNPFHFFTVLLFLQDMKYNVFVLFCFVLKISPLSSQTSREEAEYQSSENTALLLFSKYHLGPWLNFISSVLDYHTGQSVCIEY